MTEIFNLSLKDFVLIIKKSLVSLLIYPAIGLISAFIYLLFAPNVYMATAQFQLSQIRGGNYEWSNLEDPSSIVARMRIPSSISDKTLYSCQYASGAELVKNIQVGVIKTVPPTIEILLKNRSPELSLVCTEAIVDDIKNYQSDLTKKKIIQYQEGLDYYAARLGKLKKQYPILPTSQSQAAAVDEIAAKEEVKWITDKVLALDSFIRFADEGCGKLISPVYVSPVPVSPKRAIVMAAGLLLGLLLGLLVAIFRHGYLPRLRTLQ